MENEKTRVISLESVLEMSSLDLSKVVEIRKKFLDEAKSDREKSAFKAAFDAIAEILSLLPTSRCRQAVLDSAVELNRTINDTSRQLSKLLDKVEEAIDTVLNPEKKVN